MSLRIRKIFQKLIDGGKKIKFTGDMLGQYGMNTIIKKVVFLFIIL